MQAHTSATRRTMDYLLTCCLFRIPAEHVDGTVQSGLHVSPEGRAQKESVPHGNHGLRRHTMLNPGLTSCLEHLASLESRFVLSVLARHGLLLFAPRRPDRPARQTACENFSLPQHRDSTHQVPGLNHPKAERDRGKLPDRSPALG